jgi:hypothetical protein
LLRADDTGLAGITCSVASSILLEDDETDNWERAVTPTFPSLKVNSAYFVTNKIHEKISQFWLAKSSAIFSKIQGCIFFNEL